MSKSKTRKKINNYIVHLDEPLGSGAFATVYKAHDEHSNTLFAVKIIDRLKSTHNSIQCRPTSTQLAAFGSKYRSTNLWSTPTSSAWQISSKPPTITTYFSSTAAEATCAK